MSDQDVAALDAEIEQGLKSVRRAPDTSRLEPLEICDGHDVGNYPLRCIHCARALGRKEGQEEAASDLAAKDRELADWRGWAQFVYLNGGPVTLDDKALRAAVCATHDKEVAACRRQLAAKDQP
jgi:hypothetical protein